MTVLLIKPAEIEVLWHSTIKKTFLFKSQKCSLSSTMVMSPYEQNIPKEVFSNKQNVELSENIQCWLWQVKRCLIPMYIPLSWCIFKKYWCVFEKSLCLFYNLVMYMYILFRKSWYIFEKAWFICETFWCIVYYLMIYIRNVATVGDRLQNLGLYN